MGPRSLLLGCALLLALPVRAQEVPLERLDRALRREVEEVQRDPTVTCRVERAVVAEPRIYRHLLVNLPLASRAVRALELGQYVIEDDGPGRFTIDDTRGAFARAVLARDEDGLALVVARGHVEASILPRVHGTGVITVRYEPDPARPELLRCACDVAFRVQSRALHLAAGPFRGPLERVLTDKLADLVEVATGLAEALTRDGPGVLRRLEALKALTPAELEGLRTAVQGL